jgi:hypothetical protein
MRLMPNAIANESARHAIPTHDGVYLPIKRPPSSLTESKWQKNRNCIASSEEFECRLRDGKTQMPPYVMAPICQGTNSFWPYP